MCHTVIKCTDWIMCFFVKQKTAYEMRISDWSSDVCSSDLGELTAFSFRPICAEPQKYSSHLVQTRRYQSELGRRQRCQRAPISAPNHHASGYTNGSWVRSAMMMTMSPPNVCTQFDRWDIGKSPLVPQPHQASRQSAKRDIWPMCKAS